MQNLASKYRPRELSDITEQNVVVDIVKNICESEEITNRNFLFIGPAGTGKALPDREEVLTTEGFILMKDVKVGTQVITHKGNVGTVSGVYPQGTRPIYRITLEDSRYIDVSDNHLNIVVEDGNDTELLVETVDLLKEDYRKYYIPKAKVSRSLTSALACCSESSELVIKDKSYIKSIEQVFDEECTCIMVDHPDHSFISHDLIPTHNTTTCRCIAGALNDGSLNNVIELDAASHGGVNDVRELIEQMRSYPVGSKYKTFILDECHAFSSSSWQSLLKTLEEQPAKSLVMLCTTNPEKIPATILSRVQTFQLSKISLDGIYNRLKYIIEQENKEGRNITYTEDALLFIAKSANGGMRDAITLLDKALSYSTNITIESLQKSLGLPDYDQYFELLNSIAKKDNEKIVKIINEVYNSGVNFVKWFDGFFSFVTNIVKFIYLQDINQTMIPSIYQDKIKNYGVAHSALCLKLSNKLVKMNAELKTTQYLQELAISYLCTAPTLKKG